MRNNINNIFVIHQNTSYKIQETVIKKTADTAKGSEELGRR